MRDFPPGVWDFLVYNSFFHKPAKYSSSAQLVFTVLSQIHCSMSKLELSDSSNESPSFKQADPPIHTTPPPVNVTAELPTELQAITVCHRCPSPQPPTCPLPVPASSSTPAPTGPTPISSSTPAPATPPAKKGSKKKKKAADVPIQSEYEVLNPPVGLLFILLDFLPFLTLF